MRRRDGVLRIILAATPSPRRRTTGRRIATNRPASSDKLTPAFRATAARSMLDVLVAPKSSDSSMGALDGWKARSSGTRNEASLYAQRSNVMAS